MEDDSVRAHVYMCVRSPYQLNLINKSNVCHWVCRADTSPLFVEHQIANERVRACVCVFTMHVSHTLRKRGSSRLLLKSTGQMCKHA